LKGLSVFSYPNDIWVFCCTDDAETNYKFNKLCIDEFPNIKNMVTGFDGFCYNLTGRMSKPGAFGSAVQVGYQSSWLPTIYRLVGQAAHIMTTRTPEEIRDYYYSEDMTPPVSVGLEV